MLWIFLGVLFRSFYGNSSRFFFQNPLQTLFEFSSEVPAGVPPVALSSILSRDCFEIRPEFLHKLFSDIPTGFYFKTPIGALSEIHQLLRSRISTEYLLDFFRTLFGFCFFHNLQYYFFQKFWEPSRSLEIFKNLFLETIKKFILGFFQDS